MTQTMPAIEVRSPVDRTVVGTVPEQSSGEVAETVAALRRHQPAWASLNPAARAAWLRRYRDWLLHNADRITAVLQSETGKRDAEAAVEVPALCEVINYFADNATKFLADDRVPASGVMSLPKRLTIAHHPYPVVGVIAPWNFPVLTPGFDVVPALLAGAAVVLKPSEFTPLSALELVRGWREINAPNVFEVVTGTGPAGASVVDQVDFVQFTGSGRTGRLIAHRAVDRSIPYSLELGGKDPAIVLADADLDRAVPGVAWGGLFNAGQVCISIERVYVEAPIYDEFVSRITDFVSKLGPSDVGPLATAAQRDIVAGHVSSALAAGARATVGGRGDSDELTYPPTVLVDVDHGMACIREETFGPTLPIIKVADADEAVRLANDTEYGLSASVWTRDKRRGEQLARRLQAGAVNINDAAVNLFAITLPHGGWKTSGSGARFGGRAGMLKYTRQQAITSPRLQPTKSELLWFPYRPRRSRTVARALRFIAGHNARRWFRL